MAELKKGDLKKNKTKVSFFCIIFFVTERWYVMNADSRTIFGLFTITFGIREYYTDLKFVGPLIIYIRYYSNRPNKSDIYKFPIL
jgi:hypothetical protein